MLVYLVWDGLNFENYGTHGVEKDSAVSSVDLGVSSLNRHGQNLSESSKSLGYDALLLIGIRMSWHRRRQCPARDEELPLFSSDEVVGKSLIGRPEESPDLLDGEHLHGGHV